jgi:hypothetical protein
VTLTNNGLVSPFLSPGTEVVEDGPRMSADGSTEGMRRLRHPFGVEPAATRTATTRDEPNTRSPQRASVNSC